MNFDTDYDIMSTPFQRDILDELAKACRKYGLKICWYHSIMDWHHPDYLPRRNWEMNRKTEGADFNRYVIYMKNQLQELLNNYGDIGVLWFDGECEEMKVTKITGNKLTVSRGEDSTIAKELVRVTGVKGIDYTAREDSDIIDIGDDFGFDGSYS